MTDFTPLELHQYLDSMIDVFGRVPIPTPIRSTERVLVLDRIGAPSADYVLAGVTECIDCAHPVLMDAPSVALVRAQSVLPLCRLCACILADSGLLTEATYLGRIR